MAQAAPQVHGSEGPDGPEAIAARGVQAAGVWNRTSPGSLSTASGASGRAREAQAGPETVAARGVQAAGVGEELDV
ncbi:hypothetical protein [Streptomyces sp. SAI-127]|uniref:hypothetical protein n=1 Tax=Streptomyces sp. SAI-127 TaxID=2940543 RepID=UPI0024751659|nr:hypothetical protein [Streptomyces sp. SAI-127]